MRERVRVIAQSYFTGEKTMPRKQRFKPTRKPKLTNEGATERALEQQPSRASSDDSSGGEEQQNERRGE